MHGYERMKADCKAKHSFEKYSEVIMSLKRGNRRVFPYKCAICKKWHHTSRKRKYREYYNS